MRTGGGGVAVVAMLVLLALPGAASAGEWVAGDLHVHTTYSHDSYGGPTDDNTDVGDAYTLGQTVTGQFAVAASRGLDYLAITDHNDIRSQTDPGFGFGGLLAIPAYENSLNGHAQMLGARKLYDAGDKSPAAVRALAEALRADGGVFQANHPADPKWEYAYDVPVDTVEVWNLPWYYQPPFPAASDNDTALAYWQGWLDRGARVTATGGSDNHYALTTAAQGAGQPTTWVYVRERSVAGVLAGLREGHTFVSHEPPALAGAQVFIEGDADRDGAYESIAGDTVPTGSSLRVRVTGAAGASLRLVTDGGQQLGPAVAVGSADFEHRFQAPAGITWVTAQVYGEDLKDQREDLCQTLFGSDLAEQTTYCRNRVAMLALSSPLYLRDPATPPGSPSVAPGRARMHVPRHCRRRRFAVTVTGRRVDRVSWVLDGTRAGTVRTPEADGAFKLHVVPRRLTTGRHQVLARVAFEPAAATRRVTLRGRFGVCGRRSARFTG